MANVHSAHKYEFEPEECTDFDEFVSEIKSLGNWSAVWFQTARRFFLYGGGKEYRPRYHKVDHIVDYITALESVLVPERDGFIGRRLRERAVALLGLTNIDRDKTKRLLRDFYNVRSTIIHGSDILSIKPEVFKKNIDLEVVLRKILVRALRVLPEEEKDRVEKVFSDFCKIKSETEKRKCFERISGRINCNVTN